MRTKEKPIKYYLIQYLNNGKNDYIKSTKVLNNGRIYTKDNTQFRVIRKVTLKYTFDDILNLYNIMSQYNIGSIQYNLALKMNRAMKQIIPKISFNSEERDIIRLAYWENEYNTESEKKTLEKILNIK